MINENSAFMTEKQLRNAVDKLNTNNFQSLDTEWEIAVLNTLSKVGQVENERNLGGSSNPDVFFTTSDGHSFVADITTVSDEGFEDEYPVEYFHIELQERIKKTGIVSGGFHLTIDPLPTAGIEDPTRVAIPKRGDFSKEFFTPKFKTFLNEVKNNPNQPLSFAVNSTSTKITLSYNPGSEFFTSNLPAYTKARQPRKNPVFNSLKSKHSQLSKSGYKGTRGIILCDAGTDMFQIGLKSTWQPEYNAEDVVEQYLGKNSSIDFVLLLKSDWVKKQSYEPGPARYVAVTIIPNRTYEALPKTVQTAIYDLIKQFPEPLNTSAGARKTIRRKYDPKTFRSTSGGFVLKGNKISVSSNSILALMAGYVSHDDFMKSIGSSTVKPGEKPKNMFASKIEGHMRISKVTVEGRNYSDDDNLTFEFAHDAGTSDFTVPIK